MRKVLSSAEKLHHTAYVVGSGRYFLLRLLWLTNVLLTGEQLRGGEVARGRLRENADEVRITDSPIGKTSTFKEVVFRGVDPGSGAIPFGNVVVAEIRVKRGGEAPYSAEYRDGGFRQHTDTCPRAVRHGVDKTCKDLNSKEEGRLKWGIGFHEETTRPPYNGCEIARRGRMA